MRSIHVSGVGTAEYTPDTAQVTFSISMYSEELLHARTEAAHRLHALMDVLDQLNIQGQDRRTNRFNVRADHYESKDRKSVKVRGYYVDTTLTVTVRNLDSLGELLDRAVDAGAGVTWNLEFYLADPIPPNQVARKNAVIDARNRAEVLASEAGVRVGRALKISERDFGITGSFRMESVKYMASASPERHTPVHAGTGEASVEIDIVWKLEDLMPA